jgi:hypothetical protein
MLDPVPLALERITISSLCIFVAACSRRRARRRVADSDRDPQLELGPCGAPGASSQPAESARFKLKIRPGVSSHGDGRSFTLNYGCGPATVQVSGWLARDTSMTRRQNSDPVDSLHPVTAPACRD